jgi:hypothetical protein
MCGDDGFQASHFSLLFITSSRVLLGYFFLFTFAPTNVTSCHAVDVKLIPDL